MNKRFILDQYQAIINGQPWYGESVSKSLQKIPIKLINSKPRGTSHSIAALIQHMISWRNFVIEKLNGHQAYDIKINTTDDWNDHLQIEDKEQLEDLIAKFTTTQDTLLELIDSLDEDSFEKPAAGKSYSTGYMVWGILLHDIYHQGQINLLYAQLSAN